ncbi:MAG: hypothetical protein SFW62_06955 [Alphaproteobacteria bacterium]|nr:hypothetical protein [Alphaproteobacteria bacterium]
MPRLSTESLSALPDIKKMKKYLLLCVLSGLLCATPCQAAEIVPEAIPAASYFPIVPLQAGVDETPQLLPVASNRPLEGDHTGLTRAVFIIHDISRNAESALAMMVAMAGPASASTIILAPQFLLEADIARFAKHLPEQGKMFARWPLGQWEEGGDSAAAVPRKAISSFTALDLLLLYVGDRKFFPDLKEIVIAGHGTGGDFVQRYAASGKAIDVLDQQNIPIRFVSANASSYLYFTSMRPTAGKRGFSTPDAKACPNFNAYRYGLDNANAYIRRAGANAIKLNYPLREVFYLTGEKAAGPDILADTSCAALLEGPDRIARAANYKLYLSMLFGETAGKRQTFSSVPQAGYDPVAVFGSRCGMAALFGDGMCEPPSIRTLKTPQ